MPFAALAALVSLSLFTVFRRHKRAAGVALLAGLLMFGFALLSAFDWMSQINNQRKPNTQLTVNEMGQRQKLEGK